jgi:hypothetical protein
MAGAPAQHLAGPFQRLVIGHQVLVEAEALAIGQVDGRVDAVDAIGDFVDIGARLRVGDHRQASR